MLWLCKGEGTARGEGHLPVTAGPIEGRQGLAVLHPSRLRAAGPWHPNTLPKGGGICAKVTLCLPGIKVPLPPALLHSAQQAGSHCQGQGQGFLSQLKHKGTKTKHTEAAQVFWDTAGLWHLWLAHIPQLCPSLPAGHCCDMC